MGTWFVHKLAIIAVPFDGLKNKGVPATGLQSKTQTCKIVASRYYIIGQSPWCKSAQRMLEKFKGFRLPH